MVEVKLTDNIDDWFVDNVLVLEPVLTGFLRKNWNNQEEVSGLRQEIYARVFKSALKERPIYCRSFLFTTARNLLIDRARRAKVVSIENIADMERLTVPCEQPGAEEILSFRQELTALQSALSTLPQRCREIVVMRKIDGLSQREVAREMGIAEGTVEKQLSKGIRRLANALYGKGGDFEGSEAPWSKKYIEQKK